MGESRKHREIPRGRRKLETNSARVNNFKPVITNIDNSTQRNKNNAYNSEMKTNTVLNCFTIENEPVLNKVTENKSV